jgi:hypothetical protein
VDCTEKLKMKAPTMTTSFLMRFSWQWKLFFGGVVLLFFLVEWDYFTMRWYPNHGYPKVQKLLLSLTNAVKFSVGDIIYGAIIAVFFLYLGIWIWKRNWLKLVHHKWLPLFLLWLVFAFHFHWGFLYQQTPWKEKLHYTNSLDVKKLHILTDFLVEQTNLAYVQQEFQPFKSEKDISLGKLDLKIQNKQWMHAEPNIKVSMFSDWLSYMGFTGYLNPFTLEAHYNKNIPEYTQPFTILHELVHQGGIAAEAETNFMAYLLCIQHKKASFRYSGYVVALRYCLRALERLEENSSKPYIKKLHTGVLEHFEASKAYLEKYDHPIADITKVFYDTFLKFQQQPEGIESYQGLVFYLWNYYQKDLED